MANRSDPVNLIMTVVGFLVFMVLVLVVVAGFGFTAVELLIWVAFLLLGLVLIGARYRAASHRHG